MFATPDLTRLSSSLLTGGHSQQLSGWRVPSQNPDTGYLILTHTCPIPVLVKGPLFQSEPFTSDQSPGKSETKSIGWVSDGGGQGGEP